MSARGKCDAMSVRRATDVYEWEEWAKPQLTGKGQCDLSNSRQVEQACDCNNDKVSTYNNEVS